MGCKNYFSHCQQQCPDAIVIKACLQPSLNFKWTIEDKFGNRFSGLLTSDAEGSISIPVSDALFPPGFFMSFSGSFLLTAQRYISESEMYAAVFGQNGIEYSGAVLTFYNITNTPEE